MQISRNKPEGQKMLAKLRQDGELWVTAFEGQRAPRRVKIIPLSEDACADFCEAEYLVMWKQKLWLMYPYKEGHGVSSTMMITPAGVSRIPDKYTFGMAVEHHERPRS